MTGRWVRWWSSGTAARSIVLRVYVSNVRMPRSHRMTFGLPELTMYSAAISHSSIGRAVAALEHHRPGDPPDVAQQRVVLHVPGADLEDVGVLGDDVDLVRLHDLGDDRQAGPLARLGEVAQRLDAEALERVRARSAA